MNLDLFHRIEKRLCELEAKGLVVGFWHIERRMRPLLAVLC